MTSGDVVALAVGPLRVLGAPFRALGTVVRTAIESLQVALPFPVRASVVLLVGLALVSWALRGWLPRLLGGALKLSAMAAQWLGTALVVPPGTFSLWMRRRTGRPVAASLAGIYGNVVEGAVSAWNALAQQLGRVLGRPRRFSAWWGVAVGLVVWLSWNFGPCVAEGQLTPRIQQSASWWASMEGWVVNGKWTPQVAPVGVTAPMCQQQSVAMRLLVTGD